MVGTILTWLVVHRNNLVKAVLGLCVAFLLSWCTILRSDNKKLSESLERAQNNIEAYQGSLQGSQQANNVLRLTVDDLKNYNDSLVHQLDSVRKELKIKSKYVTAAATQTQLINVTDGTDVKDSAIIVKDSIYTDKIKFNDLTTVYFSLTNDSVRIGLDIRNRQYFYLYVDMHYKNKKSFLKRLFTFDFKKVNTYKYNIVNENDLVKTEDVKVIEIVNK